MERQIKGGKHGKYNLDFIDYQNEYDNICNYDSDEESDKDLPDKDSIHFCCLK